MSEPTRPGNNARLGLILVGIVLTMVSASFAAVPFYSWFCKQTGFAGTPRIAKVAPAQVLDKTISIRFDANTDPNMPWTFKPIQNEMTVHIGETALAFFEAYNPTDHTIAGSASYNVSPDLVGSYFNKIQCFCFTEQILKAHERAVMPVTFFVDPAITKDSDAMRIHQITLSYTFYQTELPKEQASLSPAPKAAYN